MGCQKAVAQRIAALLALDRHRLVRGSGEVSWPTRTWHGRSRAYGCRARVGNAAENFAIMRQVAINLIKQEKVEKVGIKTKRKMCGWDHDYLLSVLRLRRPPNR